MTTPTTNRGFEGRTMCLKGLHDLTIPGVMVTTPFGTRFCGECKRLANARRKSDPRACRYCKTMMPPGRGWAFCSVQCERFYRSSKSQIEVREESGKSLTLLALYEELERETRAWMRPEIKQRIEAFKARYRP